MVASSAPPPRATIAIKRWGVLLTKIMPSVFVGVEISPANKTAVLAPYLILALAIATSVVASWFLLKRSP
jgi:hypothetical protein